jgi:transposase-like protein
MEAPKTLQQAIQFFSNFENCRQFMISVRWEDGVVRCPECGSTKVSYLAKARVYRCYVKHPKQKFSLKVGTIFEDSPLPLEKWLPAVWLIVSAKNGISSYEIHRALGVTQKSAWFMMHRIRLAMQSNSFVKIGGEGEVVEADETFIGGKSRNMHKHIRARKITAAGMKDKTTVVGVLERGGDVRAMVVKGRKRPELQAAVRQHVAAGSALYTDALRSYVGLDEYEHKVVDHAMA